MSRWTPGILREFCYSGLHKMTEDNVYVRPKTGKRTCRECKKRHNPKPLMTREEIRKLKDLQKQTRLLMIEERKKNTPIGKQAYVKQYKQSHSCADCLESDPICLDFHHREPKDKLFEIVRHSGKTLDELKIEIGKCDLVCANCHRKRHKNEGYPTNGRLRKEMSLTGTLCRNNLHERTPDNTMKSGICRACRRASQKRRREHDMSFRIHQSCSSGDNGIVRVYL